MSDQDHSVLASCCSWSPAPCPAAALADDERTAPRSTPASRTARGRDAAATRPCRSSSMRPIPSAVTGPSPQGVTSTPICRSWTALAAYLTPEEIEALGRRGLVSAIVADNPVFGIDYRSTMDVTNLTIGLGDVLAPTDGRPDRRRRDRGRPRQRHRDAHRPGRQPHRRLEGLREGQEDALRRRRSRHLRRRSHRRRRQRIAAARPGRQSPSSSSAAWRPAADIVAHQGARRVRPGRAST